MHRINDNVCNSFTANDGITLAMGEMRGSVAVRMATRVCSFIEGQRYLRRRFNPRVRRIVAETNSSSIALKIRNCRSVCWLRSGDLRHLLASGVMVTTGSIRRFRGTLAR